MDNKKHCVVITAYKNETNLRNLLALLHEKMWCYVHVDIQSKDYFSTVMEEFPDVIFLSKYRIYWGGAEHLLAICDLLKMALQNNWEYVHIISGEDFPVKEPDYIISQLVNDMGIYANYWPVFSQNGKFKDKRYRYYWLYTKYSQNYRSKIIRLFNLGVIAFQVVFPFFNKKCIGEFKEIYTGYVWGSFPRYSIEYVLSYMENHAGFLKELMWCKIPEELCFSTILMNSPYKELVRQDNLRYWNMNTGDGYGPGYLTIDDVPCFKNSSTYFARKVNSRSEVMEILRTMVIKQQL